MGGGGGGGGGVKGEEEAPVPFHSLRKTHFSIE